MSKKNRHFAWNFRHSRLAFETLESRQLLSVSALISEFMAINHSTLKDADGDYSDWIEIQNPTSAAVDLNGWSLTDDQTKLGKWHFPSVTVAAGGYLVVFASGKDRAVAGSELHTNFQLDGKGEYLALVEPDGGTIATQFDPYPEQRMDVSFGLAEQTAATLVAPGATAKTLIPANNALGQTWTGGLIFDDTAWTSGTTGVGYDTNTMPAPAAYWNFNETVGANAADASGNGHDGTLENNPIWSGTSSGGLTFNGLNQTVSAPIDVSESSMTISLWFKTTTANCGLFEVADGSLEANGYDRLFYLTSGNIAARLWSDETIASTGLNLADGQWHHLAYDFGGIAGGQQLYIDGVLRASGSKNYSDFYWQTSVVIGYAGDSSHPFFQGSVDEVAIWNTAISTLQIQSLAQGGSPLGYEAMTQPLPTAYWKLDESAGATTADASGNGYSGTLIGGCTWTTGKNGNGLDFNGTNGYIDAPVNVSESAATISLWFKTTSPNTGLFETSDGGTSCDRGLHLKNGNVEAFLYNTEWIDTTGLNLADGQWHHVGYTYGGNIGGQKIYVDGTLRAGGFKSQSDFNWDNRVYLGHSAYAGQPFFQGVLDDVAIWNTAFTATQMQSLAQGRSPLNSDSIIGTNVNAAMRNVNSSAYVRIPFSVSSPADVQLLRLNMKYDDGYVAWLNGVEIARRNAPATLAYDSTATAARSEGECLTAEEFEWPIAAGVLHSGTNILAIQGLTNNKATGAFLVLPELLQIQTVSDRYMLSPSPGRHNGEGILGFAADVNFSADHGFYDAPFTLALATDTPGATLRYTLNGTEPTATTGMLYSGPLTIGGTSIVRAAAFKNGYHAGDVNTQSYIFTNDVVQQSTMSTIITNDPIWGPQLRAALLAIPTISLVTSSPLGSNSPEAETSVEMINPDGTKGFQINAGIERFGGASLNWLPKRSFRISFKEKYGEAKLNYDLFGDGAATEFDQILLRSESFDSEFYPNGTYGSLLRSHIASGMQLAMGNPGVHARFAHVYVNGVYEGEYSIMERPNAAFMASYFGGSKEDYDAFHADNPGRFVDGDGTAWNAMISAISSGNYQAVQQYMNVTNYADYMLVEFYVGNTWDWGAYQNWNAARKRETGAGYVFFCWDADMDLRGQGPPGSGTTLDGHDANTVGYGGPANLWNSMIAFPEFKILVADRAQKFFFNSGIFTTPAAQAFFDGISSQISTSIIAECARWGNNPGQYLGWSLSDYTPATWQSVVDTMRNYIMAGRDAVVIQQLRDAGIFPAVAAPVFSQRGGPVYQNYQVTLSAPTGNIYYTIDGSDPRLAGGSISPTAQLYQGNTITTPLIASGTTWKYNDYGVNLGTTWRGINYNDTAWRSGPSQLGYGDGDEATVIQYRSTAVYFRRSFTVSNPAQFTGLTLDLLRDDGAVVYINGTEVARSNMPTGLVYISTHASTDVNGADEATFHSFAINPAILVSGTNTIAVEIHQFSKVDNDISFDLHLNATTTTTPVPININDTTLIKVRALSGGLWSPIDEALFIVDAPASVANLVVSEINYNPPAPTAAELAVNPAWTGSDFEYLELKNTSGSQIDLTGVKITAGVTFDFTDSYVVKLAPGDYVLAVKNSAAFQARYGTSKLSRIAGTYSGLLSNSGELVTMIDHSNANIFSFTYGVSGAWPSRADGKGSSLELNDPAAVPTAVAARSAYLEDAAHWRSSSEYYGTPASTGTGPISSIVVNEVLTHTDLPLLDSIELYNTTNAAIDIGGWYLSDSSTNYQKYCIPVGTLLAPHEYRVFNANDFGVYFLLNADEGDDVWLISADASGKLAAFVDHVQFGAAANGESLGRWPNGTGDLYPLKNRTLGEPNDIAGDGPRIGPLVISEIMYNPTPLVASELAAGFTTSEDLEFVEIYNPTLATVDLTNWQLGSAVGFSFPVGTLLPSGSSLVVVPFDASNPALLAAFRSRYGMSGSLPVAGAYSGHLDNQGEKLQLLRADAPTPTIPPIYPMLLEDEAAYTPAWGAMGNGNSLHRLATNAWGNNGASWTAAAPTAGTVNIASPIVAAADDWTVAGLTLKIGGDGKLHLYRTGTTTDVVLPMAIAKITGVSITGRDNIDDVLTIDFSAGNPIPLGSANFNGGAGGGNTLIIVGTANDDNTTMTATQIAMNGSAAIIYSNTSNQLFNLGGGTNSLLIDSATLNLTQDNAISSGTNVTVSGGVLNYNGHIDIIGNLVLINGGQVTATAISNTTTSIAFGTLTAASLVCDTLTIGSSAGTAGSLNQILDGGTDVTNRDPEPFAASDNTPVSIGGGVNSHLVAALPPSLTAAWPVSEQSFRYKINPEIALTVTNEHVSASFAEERIELSPRVIFYGTTISSPATLAAQFVQVTSPQRIETIFAKFPVQKPKYRLSTFDAVRMNRIDAHFATLSSGTSHDDVKLLLLDGSQDMPTPSKRVDKQLAAVNDLRQNGVLTALQSAIQNNQGWHSTDQLDLDSLHRNHSRKLIKPFAKAVDAVLAEI